MVDNMVRRGGCSWVRAEQNADAMFKHRLEAHQALGAFSAVASAKGISEPPSPPTGSEKEMHLPMETCSSAPDETKAVSTWEEMRTTLLASGYSAADIDNAVLERS